MDADDAFYGYHQQLDKESIAEAIRLGGGEIGYPHASGLAQTFLLSEWEKSWQRKVLKGSSLEELLWETVKGVILSPEFLAEVERSTGEKFKQALEKTRGRLTEAEPPEPNVTIWLTLPAEIVNMVDQMKEGLGNPLPGLIFPFPR